MELKPRSRTQEEIMNNMIIMINSIIRDLHTFVHNLEQQQRQSEE
jgi:hypothetical protein